MKNIRYKDLKQGMEVFVDQNFDCIPNKGPHKVGGDERTGFYIKCDEGKHYLFGQGGDFGYLVGVFVKE